jgi:hypothetical protein
MAALSGSVRLLFLFDLADEIDMEAAAAIRGGTDARRKLGPVHAPRYIGFETPPLLMVTEEAVLASGRRANVQVNAFPHGVVGVSFRFPAAPSWNELVEQTGRLLEDDEVAEVARARASDVAHRLGSALRDKYATWLRDEYLVAEIHRVEGVTNGAALVEAYRDPITQMVRGESTTLAPSEQQEVLAATISCYPSDVMVVGWAAALVYDPTEGREDNLQLLEYANYQLLEYRHYDERLKQILKELYALTQQNLPAWQRWWKRWTAVREAERLNSLRLEIRDLADRSDDSLRLLGDMFHNRAYKLISERIGLNDYRGFVEEKLKTAEDLYEFLVDQINHQRTLVLEVMVVVILIIELFNIKPHL